MHYSERWIVKFDDNDLIKEVIDELEFLLLPEEEYEDEDRKYDEYKDDKLTI